MFITRCITISVLLIGVASTPLSAAAPLRSLQVQFYDQSIVLDYQEGLAYPHEVRIEELALRRLFRQFERRPYVAFLESVQEKARSLDLNDWLYAELLNEALAKLYEQDRQSPEVTYATYFMLAKSGFDVRLTYREKQIYVNVFTEDVIYEIPVIEENGRKYANISDGGRTSSPGRSMYLLDQQPNPNGRAFGFQINRWPLILTETKGRNIAFQFRGHTYEIPVQYQAGRARLLERYPLVSESWYLDAPLSPELQQTLVPQLRRLMQGQDLQTSLELLVAFTRSGFVYQDDKQAFGTNKPMVSDELFYYPYSDCEDRCALFYALVKVLLDVPMIVIAYDDHLTVAVAAPGIRGDTVKYDGKSFVFCDPTGPQASAEIGRIPQGYEERSFEVIGYFPGS